MTDEWETGRKQRISEMKAAQQKARYGDVCEISREDYVTQVNKAGDGVWVILLVYKPSLVNLLLVIQSLVVSCCVTLIPTVNV